MYIYIYIIHNIYDSLCFAGNLFWKHVKLFFSKLQGASAKFPVKRWIFRSPFTMRLPKCLNKHPTASPTRSYQDLAPYLKIFFKTLSITCQDVAKKRLPKYPRYCQNSCEFVWNSNSRFIIQGTHLPGTCFRVRCGHQTTAAGDHWALSGCHQRGVWEETPPRSAAFHHRLQKGDFTCPKIWLLVLYQVHICTLKFISKILFFAWSLSSFMILVLRIPIKNVAIHSFQETPTSHGSCPEVHRLIFT